MNPFVNQKKQQVVAKDSVLESLRDLSSDVGKTVVSDLGGKVSSDILASLLGKTPQTGEFRQNQGVEVHPGQETPIYRPSKEQIALDELSRKDQTEMRQRIDAVRKELAALSKSIASMNIEIQKAVSETPVDAGIYHLNFLDQLRSILLSLRQKIDDGRTWLAAFNSRKQKRAYWGMYKKHGTSFGLSNERTLATQAG